MTPEETSDVAFKPSVANNIRPGRVLMGAGLVLLPWLGYLAGTLPPAEAVFWVTLDGLEAAALLVTGSRLLHGDARYRAPAAAAAVLLLADACLDLATSSELAVALTMAVAAELPLAALCAVLAAGRVSGTRGTSRPRTPSDSARCVPARTRRS